MLSHLLQMLWDDIWFLYKKTSERLL